MLEGCSPHIAEPFTNDREEVQRRVARLRVELCEIETEVRALLRLLDTSPGPTARAVRDTASRHVDRELDVEYLSIRELATRIPYSEGTIRNLMTRGAF